MNNKKWIQEKKEGYTKRKVALYYDKKRFSNYGGRYVDNKEKAIVTSYLKDELSSIARGKKVSLLDVPCGTGRFAVLFSNKGFNVTAADYSQDMLDITAKRAKVKLVKCDAYNMPFKKGKFDVVVSIRFLFHYPNPENILKELVRVTKNGGILVFCTLNKYSVRYFIEIILDLFRKSKEHKLKFVTEKELNEKIKNLGVKILTTESMFVIPTQMYGKLPKFMVKFFMFIEKFTPDNLKILRYWKVSKK
ncbi:hypothetical protein DRJ17_03525 [Candidatus Woesearchaeota archaeon]|nr:MAG: hypothetical protein DRJ17_03525 [Candidatus Woesearchaeota archaeon]